MRASHLTLVIVVAAAAGAAVLDRVAVVVGDDVITESEVQNELRLDEFMASQPLDLSPARRRTAAEQLADQQLIRHEMEISHYAAPPPSSADNMLQTFRREHFPSDAAYRAALQKYGITGDELKQHLLWQLTVLRFTDERFGSGAQSSADRAAPTAPPPAAGRTAQTKPGAPQSADRLNPRPAPGETPVDQQLDSWLKEARGSTHVEFKKEAFQ